MARTLSTDETARYWKVVEEHLIRYNKGFTPAIVTRAEGCYVFDENGRAILDFNSGQMCATVGHNHPAIVDALRLACDEPIHLYTSMLSPAVIELAEDLCRLLPPSLQKAMFLSTGGESNEAAIRMAKLKTGGFEMLSLGSAWHGMTAGAHASTFSTARKGYGPQVPGAMMLPPPNCYRCPIRHCAQKCDMTCLDVGFEMADAQSVGAYAGVICEPVLAGGGIIVPPEGYMQRLQKLCRHRGMLLIFDEAQTGLGRAGSMFYFEQTGMVPDILTLSKTLGGGVAIAATITSSEIEEELHERGFFFYTSHLSDPLPARVAQTIIRLLIEHRLVNRAREMGAYFLNGLQALQQRYEVIGDVRGIGLLLGIEFVKDREHKAPWPELGASVIKRAFELGLNTSPSGSARSPESGTVWKLAPPLTVTTNEIDEALSIIDQTIRECTASA